MPTRVGTTTTPLVAIAIAIAMLAPAAAWAQTPVGGAERRIEAREREEGLSLGRRLPRHNARHLATLTSALQRERGLTPIGENVRAAEITPVNPNRLDTRVDVLGNRFVRGVLTAPGLGVRRQFVRRELSASVYDVGPVPRPDIAFQPGFFSSAALSPGLLDRARRRARPAFDVGAFLPNSAVASPLAARRRIVVSDGLHRFQREGVRTVAPRAGELRGRPIRAGLSSMRHRFTVTPSPRPPGSNIRTGSAVRSKTSPDG